MKNIFTKALLTLALLSTHSAYAFSVQKAQMLSENGLKKEAQKELIDVIFSKSKEKAQAYYLLGNIAFEQNKISVALDSWRTLVKKYPKSKQSKLVKNRIQELAEIVGESAKESVENAIALSYLRHADFWSDDRDKIFSIDSSWIPKVEASVKWYDKVIKEFPNTNASRVAYQDKMRTLLGWKERGQYGSSYGIEKSFSTYMPQLIETFKAFEKEHSNASTLQAFRFQIAQAYWSQKDWDKTREWLNLIISKANKNDSFYKDTAQRRLKKVEY